MQTRSWLCRNYQQRINEEFEEALDVVSSLTPFVLFDTDRRQYVFVRETTKGIDINWKDTKIFAGYINRLVKSRVVDKFLASISNLPPLYSVIGTEKLPKQLAMTVSEAKETLSKKNYVSANSNN